jgi:integrase
LGIEIGKHISEDFHTIYVVQKAKRGEIQPYLKTKNGERQVDLCSALAKMLREFVASSGRRSGLLFQTSTGAQLLQSNTLGDSLHPILKRVKHQKGGFNIFRRFRLTHLEKSECPDALKHFWSGHAPKHVSERYIKLLEDRDFRLEWAEKIRLGFELPTSTIGELRVLRELLRAS